MTKAITDFSGYTASELLPAANQIHTKMDGAKPIFPSPPTALPALLSLITAYSTALAEKASRDSAKVIAFNVARHDLEEALGDNGEYVNTTAKGDPTKVAASGYPFYETTGHAPDTAPPAAPADVRLRQGDVSGALIARYKPSRPRSMNVIETCLGDPNVAANWKMAGMFSGGKATLSGFTPGTVVWVRVATAGLKGVMGAWSDPAKLMVT